MRDFFSDLWNLVIIYYIKQFIIVLALLLGVLVIYSYFLYSSGSSQSTVAGDNTTTSFSDQASSPGLSRKLGATTVAKGSCLETLTKFRKLFVNYPSGANLDITANEELNLLLPLLYTNCNTTAVTQFTTDELYVWQHLRSTG